MYVIQRTDQGGGYLGANPGMTGQTWVRDLRNARTFRTEADARKECCPGNERPVRVDDLLGRPR